MGIKIEDIGFYKASLLSDRESFIGKIRDLSEEELKLIEGGNCPPPPIQASGHGAHRDNLVILAGRYCDDISYDEFERRLSLLQSKRDGSAGSSSYHHPSH